MNSEDEKINEYMREHNKCYDCGGEEFIPGPRGGMCVNLMCANCGARFNVSPFSIERIGQPTKPPEGCASAFHERVER